MGRGLLLTLAIIMAAGLVTQPGWEGAVVCGVVELILALAWWGVRRKAIRRLEGKMSTRTLRVEQWGIAAGDRTGTMDLPWSSVTEVSVHYTDAQFGAYRLLALHVKLHDPKSEDAVVQSVVRSGPVGWPEPWENGNLFDSPSDWLPVCVLGPHRTDMKNAVAAFAKRPLDTDGSW